MALFIQQNDERSKLQEKLVAELRERTMAAGRGDITDPDLVSNSQYLENSRQTSRRAWIFWLLVLLIGTSTLLFYLFMGR